MSVAPSPHHANLDRRSVVLIGMMGAGKSTVGRRLAMRLGLPFVDADAEIEKAAGCTISEIFAQHGEAFFRDGERRVIARLLEGEPIILATGGGAWMDPATREAVRRHGISIWLQADLDVLERRCARRGNRPLLAGADLRATLARLLTARAPTYAEADICINSDEGPHRRTVQRIADALAARGFGA